MYTFTVGDRVRVVDHMVREMGNRQGRIVGIESPSFAWVWVKWDDEHELAHETNKYDLLKEA